MRSRTLSVAVLCFGIGCSNADSSHHSPVAGGDSGGDAVTSPHGDDHHDAALPDAGPGGADAARDGGMAAEGGVLVVGPESPNDVVASYLMTGGGYNYASVGAMVPIGRHISGDNPSYHTALRFSSVPVPKGAIIESAVLSVLPGASASSRDTVFLAVRGEASGHSLPFDPTNYDTGRPDQRASTKSTLDAILFRCVLDCDKTGRTDCVERTEDCWTKERRISFRKDMAAIVQEIVSQPDWESGNALTLIVSNWPVPAGDDDSAYRNQRYIVGVEAKGDEASRPELSLRYRMAP